MKFRELPTPVYCIDEDRLAENLKILKGVSERAGCKILLAQKAFSCFYFYPLISRFLDGSTASGLYESRLAYEYMTGENHVYCPAYTDGEFDEIASLCDHIVFNSMRQYEKFARRAADASIGLRVNPEFSTQKSALYDPCAPFSRLGITRENFPDSLPDRVEGLHMHTLCEQSAEELAATVRAFEERFGEYLPHLKWVNLGGGHHITKPGYNIPLLERTLSSLSQKYGVQVYIEPGEAVALDAGCLFTEVLETVHNGMDTAILDTSAECHMPDVLEMPYRPAVEGAGELDEKRYNYRLSSRTCLAGDIIGDYSFDRKLEEGDILKFADMAIYTMVKNNTFNGMPLPSIAVKRGDEYELIKSFGYGDFKGRLS